MARTPRDSMARGPRLSDYSGFIATAEAEARSAAAAAALLGADGECSDAEPVFTRARRISDMIRDGRGTTPMPTSHCLVPPQSAAGDGAPPPAQASDAPRVASPKRWHGGR
jgi:hypothetical protein